MGLYRGSNFLDPPRGLGKPLLPYLWLVGSEGMGQKMQTNTLVGVIQGRLED